MSANIRHRVLAIAVRLSGGWAMDISARSLRPRMMGIHIGDADHDRVGRRRVAARCTTIGHNDGTVANLHLNAMATDP